MRAVLTSPTARYKQSRFTRALADLGEHHGKWVDLL